MWYPSIGYSGFWTEKWDGSKFLFIVCRHIGRNGMMMMVTCIMNGIGMLSEHLFLPFSFPLRFQLWRIITQRDRISDSLSFKAYQLLKDVSMNIC